MFGNLSKKIFKPLVPVIRINGDINSTTTFLVSRSLNKIKPGRSDALGVVINSDGGSPAQCEIILKKIKEFCHEHHLPLYTFAEDRALSAGYWMLCVGDKVYADKSSALGSIGTTVTHTDVTGLFKKFNIEVRTWDSDKDKVVPSIYQEPNEVQTQNMQKWADNCHKSFISHIEQYRKSKITVPEGERKEKLYQGKVWTGKEAMEYGLVDGFGTYAAVLFKDFPKSRIVDVSEKPTLEKYREQFFTIVKLASSKALPWIIAYFVIKGCIKLYLLILVFKKKNSSDPKERQEAKELLKLEESL